MSRNLDVEQQNVFNAYEDLKAFGVPEDDWSKLEANSALLQWPSSLEGATDALWVDNRWSLTGPKANLFISYEKGTRTNFEFKTETGRITVVRRALGGAAIEGGFWNEFCRMVIPGERPDVTDYEMLATELKAARTYHEQLR